MMAETLLMVTERINPTLEKIMTALDNLQAADNALKAEVAQFLQDVSARLASSSDPTVQQVADDINAQVASLAAADTAGTATAPPADPGTAVPPVTP